MTHSVLVAESDAIELELIATVLARDGFKVLQFLDRDAAKDAFADESITLVIAAADVSGRGGGAALCADVKKARPATKFVLLHPSGNDTDACRVLLTRTGCDAVLPSPFRYDALKRLLVEWGFTAKRPAASTLSFAVPPPDVPIPIPIAFPEMPAPKLAEYEGDTLAEPAAPVESQAAEPVEAPPVEVAPVEAAPVEVAPVEAAPVEEAPVEVALVEEAPVEVAPEPIEPPPVEALSIDIEEAPVETAPVEVAPVAEPPVETAPVETVPVEAPAVQANPVDAALLDLLRDDPPPAEVPPVEAQPVATEPVEFLSAAASRLSELVIEHEEPPAPPVDVEPTEEPGRPGPRVLTELADHAESPPQGEPPAAPEPPLPPEPPVPPEPPLLAEASEPPSPPPPPPEATLAEPSDEAPPRDLDGDWLLARPTEDDPRDGFAGLELPPAPPVDDDAAVEVEVEVEVEAEAETVPVPPPPPRESEGRAVWAAQGASSWAPGGNQATGGVPRIEARGIVPIPPPPVEAAVPPPPPVTDEPPVPASKRDTDPLQPPVAAPAKRDTDPISRPRILAVEPTPPPPPSEALDDAPVLPFESIGPRTPVGSEPRTTLPPSVPPEGDLTTTPLPRLLFELYGGTYCGTLRLSRKGAERVIDVWNGFPVAVTVTPSDGNDDLLVLLREHGRITPGQADDAQRRAPGREAQLLVALGVIDERDLLDLIREQAELRLAASFSWRDGTYKITPSRSPPDSIVSEIHPVKIIWRGVSEHYDVGSLLSFFSPLRARYIVATEVFPIHYQTLGPFLRRLGVAHLFDGKTTFEHALRSDDKHALDIAHTLYVLIVTEMVRAQSLPGAAAIFPDTSPKRRQTGPVDYRALTQVCEEVARTYLSLKESDYFLMLEISRQASDDEVSSAYERLAKPFKPESLLEGLPEDVLRRAREIEAMLRRARDTLCSPEERRRYVARLDDTGPPPPPTDALAP